MMTFSWIVSACVLAVVWVLTIIDIIRRHYSTGATIGWLALIILIPFIGAIIYWIVRKPTQDELEQAYRAEADFRRGTSPRP